MREDGIPPPAHAIPPPAQAVLVGSLVAHDNRETIKNNLVKAREETRTSLHARLVSSLASHDHAYLPRAPLAPLPGKERPCKMFYAEQDSFVLAGNNMFGWSSKGDPRPLGDDSDSQTNRCRLSEFQGKNGAAYALGKPTRVRHLHGSGRKLSWPSRRSPPPGRPPAISRS